MTPHCALAACLAAGAAVVVLAAIPAEAAGRSGPAGFAMGGRAPGIMPLRPGMRVGQLPRNGRGLAWAGRRGGWGGWGGYGTGWCCGTSVPAVSGTMFPGWTAFQAPSAFGPWGGSRGGPSTVVNVNVGQGPYTAASLPTAADLPKVAVRRQPVGAPVLYVLNGSGVQRQGGARVIQIGEPKELGATSGSGFSTDSPTNPRIVELTTE